MKGKIKIAVCCALIMYVLSGCQLALENAGTNNYGDRLIGVFVTTDYLDMFDMESYLNNNIGALTGGHITVDGSSEKYNGRLYAALTEKTLTNQETGEKIQTEEYIFTDIAGIPYFSATVPAAPGRNSYVTSTSDPAISEGHISINYGDKTNSKTMKGTIYASPSSKECTYYFNPVYQSTDGSVYATSGSGFMVSQESYSEGFVYSQTLSESCIVTENGKSITDSTSVEISISIKFSPKKIVILQMNKDNSLISRTEYAPGTLPEVLAPEPDSDYLIVEAHSLNNLGDTVIIREIYSHDATNFETFFSREDGICEKIWTQIKWFESITHHL